MELDQAIFTLSNSAYTGVTTLNDDFKAAEILGIEALKAIKLWRIDWAASRFHCLPTEDYKQHIPPPREAFGTTQP